MLKQIILFLAIIHIIQGLSARSNIWWSRRDENSHQDCDIDFNNENPSLQAKICGYCFAKCQQQFAACLLAQMNQVVDRSFDLCQEKTNRCEKHCLNNKRTGEIAEANWLKIVKVLQQFNTLSTIEPKKADQ